MESLLASMIKTEKILERFQMENTCSMATPSDLNKDAQVPSQQRFLSVSNGLSDVFGQCHASRYRLYSVKGGSLHGQTDER